MKINYLDLFSGVGGFSEGIRQSGIEFAWHGFAEIDKYAVAIYKEHFPGAVELGSVTSIDGRKLPKLNLITFGFPCQDLSIAGKRRKRL
jgi:DNA (cytosine-5)-methyltransferase 1